MAKKLRPYQENMVQEIYNRWDMGDKNVLLVLPTGMGKTFCFCSIAIDKAVNAHNKMPTAIAVHRKELVQQISLTLAEEGVVHNIIAPRKTIQEIISAQRKVHGKQFYDYLAPVTVVSVDTLVARINKHISWAEGIKLWIIDEAAHVLKKNKWGRSVGYFPNAIGLGVTATPERLDKQGLGSHAKGVFDYIVEGPSVKWGITNGFLSRYKVAVPRSDYQSYLKKAGTNSDFTRGSMIEAATKSQIVGDVVDNYLKFANGKQAILFAPGISVAETMRDNFVAAGVSAELLTGLSSNADRLNGMIAFREKRIKVLLNVDLFDEGLDVPGIECVIMARPTMSFAKYRQMCGRGMRPAPGKDFLILIDHVGNVKRHGLPDRPYTWTLDDIAKKKKQMNMIRICENYECQAPYDRFLTECPYCGFKPEPKGGGERIPPEQVDGDLYLIDPDTLSEMENSTVLEDPGRVGERVSHVAGGPAGIKAMKNQQKRIGTQSELKESIAKWAGYKKQEGFTDREIHKIFYLEYGDTIAGSLAKKDKEMHVVLAELQSALKDSFAYNEQ